MAGLAQPSKKSISLPLGECTGLSCTATALSIQEAENTVNTAGKPPTSPTREQQREKKWLASHFCLKPPTVGGTGWP